MSTALLLGIPAQLKTLVTRVSATWAAKLDTLATDWTTARAGKVDNLDTTISSRAAGATALTTATWTDSRAGYLSNLSNGVPATIKNIIRVSGTVGTAAATATLGTTITLAKSFIIMTGSRANSTASAAADFLVTADLYTTSVIFSRNGASGSVTATATVVEFY